MKKSYLFKLLVFAVIAAFVTVTSCKDYDDDINKLQNEINSLGTDLTSKIDAAKNEMTSLINSEISKVNAELATAKTNLATLTSQVGTLETDLAAAKTNIATLTTKVGVLESFKTSAEADLINLKGRVTELEEKSATKAELAAVELALTNKIGAINTTLELLDGRVGKLETDYADLLKKHNKDVADLLTKISEAEGRMNVRILTLEELLGLNEEGESEVLIDIYQLIEDNADEIIAVKKDLKKKYDELIAITDTLQAQVDVLDGRITVNEGAITGLNSRMDQAEKDIKKINEETIPALDEKLQGMIGDVLKIVKNRLTSIALAPNLYIDGIEAIKFYTLNYGCMEDGDNKPVITDDKKLVTSIGAPAVANYKFNPRTFNLANADYSYADRVAEVITRAGGSSLVAIEEVKNATDGTVEFTLRRLDAHKTQPKGNKENFIQLEATLKGAAIEKGEEGVVIAAEQELVYDQIIKPADISIGDNGTNNKCGNDFIPYAYTFDAAKQMTPVYKMEYNKVFNLREKVRVCFGLTEREMEDFNLDLRFDMPDGEYYIDSEDTKTEQQKYFELVDGGAGTFKATGFNKEALGRTPIFRVELVTEDGCVIRRAFVKVEVIVAKSDDLVVGITEDLVFKCADTKTTYEITEEFIRENVYRKIAATTGEVSMSHEEFWNIYEWEDSPTSPKVVITKTPATIAANTMPDPTIVSGTTSQGTATKKIVWTFNHGQLGSLGTGGATFVATVTVKNKLVNSAYPEKVTFKFTVNAKLPAMTPEFTGNERDPYWSTDADDNPIAFMSNVAYPQTVTSPASEAQFKTYLKDAYSSYKLNLPEGTCVSALKYKILNTYSNGVKDNPKLGGVQLGVDDDGDYITLAKGNTAVEKALNSPLGLKADIEIYVTINEQDIPVHMFPVHFIRPLNINATDAEVTDGETGGSTASFLWSGLLTDWRNKPVYHGSFSWEQSCSEGWEYLPEAVAVYVPGYYELTQEASLNVEYGTVNFTTGTQTTMYKGTEVWRVSKETEKHIGWGDYQPVASSPQNTNPTLESDSYLTEAEAQNDLDAQSLALKQANEVSEWQYYNSYGVWYRTRTLVTQVGDTEFETETVPGGQTITYTYVKNITYVAATYVWVPGYTDYQYLPWTPKPTTNGTPSERVNNWVWQETCHDYVVTDFGQYWLFYGPIGDFTVHVDRATTSLSDGKVPSGVTLTATANGIKYVNIGAAVTSDYVITIPVSINYGWGTVETNFYVTVKKSI